MSQAAENSIREGKVSEALMQLQDSIRDDPSNASLRVFLFQLLAIKGDWNRALTQLNVAAELDSSTILMAQAYRELLQCEGYRAAVFQGERAPLLFGEPPEWMGKIMQALSYTAKGDIAAAKDLTSEAFEQASVRSGSINEKPFEWIGDADMRMGPVLEAIINGKYYWVPFENIQSVTFTKPEDLRDLIWLPAEFSFTNEGTIVGFVPARYAGEKTTDDPLLALGRKTEWEDLGEEFFVGSGQKMFATESEDFSLLDIHQISFAPAE